MALHNLSLTNTLTGEVLGIDVDRLVLVGARTSNNDLLAPLKVKLSDKPIHSAGDCRVPGIIQAAVLSGHTIARKILDPSISVSDVKREQIFQ